MTHGAPASFAAVMARSSSSSDVCVSMMIASAPALDERLGLLGERPPDLVLGEVAVRLHQPAERPDVAEHPAFPAAERGARDLDAGPVDRGDVVGMPVAIEHDARAAERVGDDAVRAGLGVAPLDRQHALGVGQVPGLAAIALLEPGDHELRAHRAVAEQRPFSNLVLQTSCHRSPAPPAPRASAK